MNAEETKSYEMLRLALARKTAVIFAVCAVVTLISLTFAFVQSTVAKKQMLETLKQHEVAIMAQNENQARLAFLEAQLKICQSEKRK